MADTLEVCRNVYNAMLNDRNYQYDVTGKSPSRVDQINLLPGWRKSFPEIADVHSQVLQNISFRVEGAFRAFFRRVKAGEKPGFPRFKGDGYDSFCYPQSGFKLHEKSIYLSKIGQLKAVLHRPVLGRIQTCTVRRQAGKWFVCFACEYEPEPLPASDLSVGIDLGIRSFAALSDGTFVENPKFFRVDEKALAKAGRKQAKTAKGSRERRKANKVLSRIHERIRNRRHNFIHQESRKIVNKFGLIAVEKLNVRGMVRNHCLAKSISDAAWSMFLSVTESKAESAVTREFKEPNHRGTSQECSGCGDIVKKSLAVRVHYCPGCGLRLDRDTNAAVNILNRALKTAVGQYSVAGIPA
jgi:putative transposase